MDMSQLHGRFDWLRCWDTRPLKDSKADPPLGSPRSLPFTAHADSDNQEWPRPSLPKINPAKDSISEHEQSLFVDAS